MKFILLIEVCQRKSVNIINQSWTILKFVEEFVTNGRIILFSQLFKEMNTMLRISQISLGESAYGSPPWWNAAAFSGILHQFS